MVIHLPNNAKAIKLPSSNAMVYTIRTGTIKHIYSVSSWAYEHVTLITITISQHVRSWPPSSVQRKCTITLCTQGTCCQFCVPRISPKGYTLPCWKVIIPIVSFLWHQREHPKAMSALHCKHHTVKLWSSLRLKSCQYKSCKILSGICCLILPSVFNSSICSTYIWGEMFWNVILHACSVNSTVTTQWQN